MNARCSNTIELVYGRLRNWSYMPSVPFAILHRKCLRSMKNGKLRKDSMLAIEAHCCMKYCESFSFLVERGSCNLCRIYQKRSCQPHILRHGALLRKNSSNGKEIIRSGASIAIDSLLKISRVVMSSIVLFSANASLPRMNLVLHFLK